MKNLQSHPTHSDVPNRFVAAFLAAILFSVLLQNAAAATKVWDGSSSGNWNTAANWTNNAVPVNGDDLLFPAVAANLTNLNNITGLRINSITFDAGANNVTLRGNPLTLTNGITAKGESTLIEIEFAITNAANQTYSCVSALQLNTISNIVLGSTTLTLNCTNNSVISLFGVISGSGSLIASGPGNVILNAANTYSGLTTINAGLVHVDNASAFGSSTAGTVLNAGTLFIEGVTLANEWLTNNSSSSALRVTSGVAGWSSNIVLNADLNVSVFTNGTLNLSGAITGTGGITKNQPGTLRYSGGTANTYSGVTTVNEGTLVLQKSVSNAALTNALVIGDASGGANADVVRIEGNAQLPNTVAVTVNSSGRFEVNVSEGAFGSLAGSGNVAANAAPPGGISPGFDNSSTMFSGIISGTGVFTKSGTGTMTLSSNNTYTGTTTVNGGTLLVNGSQPQSHVQVGNGTLGGSGTVGNITNVLAGGVAPGSSPGTLTSSNIVFSKAGSDFNVELNGLTPGTGYDQLNVRGTVSLGDSTLNVSVGGGLAPAEGQVFTILRNDAADLITGTFDGLAEGSVKTDGIHKFRVSYIGGSGNNDVTLTYTNPALAMLNPQISAGNGNFTINPNECNNLNLVITNTAATPLSGISAELSSSTPGVIVTQTRSAYPNIAAGGRGTNITPFQISTSPSFVCGSNIGLELLVITASGSFVAPFTLLSGAPARFDNNTVTAIPDVGSVDSTNVVAGITNAVRKVTVSLYITHVNDSALTISLIGPDGTTATLSTGNGGPGDGYGTNCADASRTVFDDAAFSSITTAPAPFVGTFRPQGTLAAFAGKTGTNVNGAWRLRVQDGVGGSPGALQCWSLFVCEDGGGACEFCPGTFAGSITSTDLVQTARLQLNGAESSCQFPKSCPGVGTNVNLHYDLYRFTNDSATAVCVKVSLTSFAFGVFSVAYLNHFEPTNVCNNYLADLGTSLGAGVTDSYSFSVPASNVFNVLVSEINPGIASVNYSLVVSGLECPPPALNIALVQTNKARLFWPTHGAGYLLDSTLSLSPSTWTVVTNQPIVDGPNFNVTNHVSNTNQFYRLRKPL